MDWMFVSPQSSYVEALIPSVMVLGGGTFGRWLDHKDRAFLNGICALIRRDKRPLSLFLSFFLSYNEKTALTKNLTVWHLILDFSL